MPAGVQAAVSEYQYGYSDRSAVQASVNEYQYGYSDRSSLQATLGEQLVGSPDISAARHTLAEQLLGPNENAAARQTLSEVNNITALSPEIFRVWDAAKGQYVYAPRFVWTGTKWAEIGGTVPSWKHPFLWTGV